MPDPTPFGDVIYAGAEALGAPGQRRFRIKVMNAASRTASLWLEKEQLSALGDAMEAVLKGEGYEHHQRPLDDVEPEPVFPLNSDIEFNVGQLSMGLYREQKTIVVTSAPAHGEGEEPPPGITFAISYPEAGEFRHQIARVVAAGRPPCPLCGGPMDPMGHICPRSNGHHKQG
jgi:uncharacterized repeat protein (TIGR03847 family)